MSKKDDIKKAGKSAKKASAGAKNITSKAKNVSADNLASTAAATVKSQVKNKIKNTVTSKAQAAVQSKVKGAGKASKAASSVAKNLSSTMSAKPKGTMPAPADIAMGSAKIDAMKAAGQSVNVPTPADMTTGAPNAEKPTGQPANVPTPAAQPQPQVMPPKAELPKRTGFIPNPHFSRTKRSDKKRGIRLMTNLGQDALMVSTASLNEAMSANFSYELAVFSEEFTNLKPKDLVGTKASIYLFVDDNEPLIRNGYITSLNVNQARSNEDEASYRIIIEPWMSLIKPANNCRIYQNKNVIDVITELFSDVEGAVLDTQLLDKAAHQKYEYWVQYNESRMDYLHRICHVEGIGYYYTHTEANHTLVFFDSSADLGFVKAKKPLIINPRTHEYDHLHSWDERSKFVVGKTATSTYNYLTPNDNITTYAGVDASIGKVPSVNSIESYTYSEDHHTVLDGQYETTRQNHRQGAAQHLSWLGRGNYRHLRVGDRFNVTRVPNLSKPLFKKELTIAKLTLDIEEDNNQYLTTIEALPAGVMVTPPAAKPRRMRSQETARVTGPAGSEVYTDALGRIKVQFHWDRYGKNDENTSCWMRVMNNFSGPGFGVHFTPRVGQEVTIAYENGNPNRPFVSGGVYHEKHRPPFADDNGLRSGVRTRSSKGGDASNYNELSYYDLKGAEEIFIQAERDMNVNIKNNLNVTVAHHETRTVGKTLTVDAGEKIELKVGSTRILMQPSDMLIESGSIVIRGNPVNIN